MLDFAPDVIVTQDGADPHHADPLAHLQVTMPAFPRAYRALHEIAREAAGGRWVALGGGGYTFEVVPRAWTLLFAEMLGVELDDDIPESWRYRVRADAGVPLPRHLSDDPEPEVPLEERTRADWRATASSTRPAPSSSPSPAAAIEMAGVGVWRARPGTAAVRAPGRHRLAGASRGSGGR